jgi:hypothetical protein
MNKGKSKNRKQNKNIVSEPNADYTISSKQENTIILSSLKEQEEANYIYWLSLTPEKRFELHYNLVTHFFSDEIKKNKNSNNNIIYFE